MPARARKETIRRDEVGYYHCYNRCVRRAFLCGVDPLTGNDYGHRKTWIQERLETLAAAFAVEVCDFSVMDNHLHLVLRNRPDLVPTWSEEEVARRWWQLCPQRRDQQGEPAEPHDVELNVWLNDPDKMRELRDRLSDISWFMKLLCQHIARQANREDQVSGKFWESRFHAVPLLDEEALLACSLYVDLNPIRAGKADTPEASEFTSAHERILALRQWDERQVEKPPPCLETVARVPEVAAAEADLWLAPISLTDDSVSPAAVQSNPFPARRASNRGFLPLTLPDYLQLLDWTGRQLRSDKRGVIPPALLPILQRLNVDASQWPTIVADFSRLFRSAAGRAESLMKEAQRTGRRWLHGVRQAAQVFG